MSIWTCDRCKKEEKVLAIEYGSNWPDLCIECARIYLDEIEEKEKILDAKYGKEK